MRIRKNSRRVLLDGATPSASFIICHLNRSPWDVQDDWDNHLPINGSLNESKPTSSIGSGDSMELLFEYVEKTTPPQSQSQSQSGREKAEEVIGGFGVVPPAGPPPRPAPLPPKKPAPPASTVVKKRGRPRKPRTNINNNNDDNNPYQFYYYSGFGPSWSKRRGGSNPLNCDDIDKDNGNGNGMETPGCSSTTRESIMSYDNDDDEKISKPDNNSYYNNNNNNNNNNGVVIESFESVLDAEKELDYIGDEEEEDEELYGGKGVRKPIKARSLKSLM